MNSFRQSEIFLIQVPVSKSAQGVTGLESKRLVSDDRLEVGTADVDDVEDDDDEGSSSADSDDSDYIPYKVCLISIWEVGFSTEVLICTLLCWQWL